jgi:uncharacterized membrane protein YidH (DUF202 family)
MGSFTDHSSNERTFLAWLRTGITVVAFGFISRKGVRKKKLEIVQVWRCGSCKRNFTPGPAALRNKTYPIRLVLQALTLYNLGYSLNETAKRLKSKSGRAVDHAPSKYTGIRPKNRLSITSVVCGLLVLVREWSISSTAR